MYARLRKDLIEAEEYPPLLNCKKQELTKIYEWYNLNWSFECWQPEALDNEEFNLLLIDKENTLFYARSIDFEFEEE